MDTPALFVIVVAGAVALAALWIGAGWLRQASRTTRRPDTPGPTKAAADHPVRTADPRPAQRADVPAGALAAAAAIAAAPTLADAGPGDSTPSAEPSWSSTNFPVTVPQSQFAEGDDRFGEDNDRDLVAEFAETLPMEFLSN